MDLIENKDINVCRHPWELSRVECLIKEIDRYHCGKNVLDIGCGDSYFDRRLLSSNKDIKNLYGIDIFLDKGFKDKNYIVVNNYDKLNNKKFDSILMFDVLEHVEDDTKFMDETVLPLLNKNGKIIMTVPAYQSLFSKHDEELKHYRRYNIKEIKNICNKLDLKIINYHYFYFSLVPVRIISKIMNTDNKVNTWNRNDNHIITRLVKRVLNIDYAICKLMGKLSMGLSLFVVIEKK